MRQVAGLQWLNAVHSVRARAVSRSPWMAPAGLLHLDARASVKSGTRRCARRPPIAEHGGHTHVDALESRTGRSSKQAQGRRRFSSFRIDAAMATDAEAGAYQALPVLSRLTISAPPCCVRWPSPRCARAPRPRGCTPFDGAVVGIGTIESPWAPSTIASTSCTDAPVRLGDEPGEARRVQHAGHPDDALRREPGLGSRINDRTITSSGFVTTITIASGECWRIVLGHAQSSTRPFTSKQIRTAHARLARLGRR